MKVHLGTLDIPYTDNPEITTEDVAAWLEEKYGIMNRFWNLHKQQFAEDLADSVAGTIENMMAGGPPNMNPYAAAIADIENQFHLFIQFEDITVTGVEGVPTKAALKGVNHRLKSKHGVRRPSFVDTGLYENSFKAWVEGNL